MSLCFLRMQQIEQLRELIRCIFDDIIVVNLLAQWKESDRIILSAKCAKSDAVKLRSLYAIGPMWWWHLWCPQSSPLVSPPNGICDGSSRSTSIGLWFGHCGVRPRALRRWWRAFYSSALSVARINRRILLPTRCGPPNRWITTFSMPYKLQPTKIMENSENRIHSDCQTCRYRL